MMMTSQRLQSEMRVASISAACSSSDEETDTDVYCNIVAALFKPAVIYNLAYLCTKLHPKHCKDEDEENEGNVVEEYDAQLLFGSGF
jgi:hypothetical protein